MLLLIPVPLFLFRPTNLPLLFHILDAVDSGTALSEVWPPCFICGCSSTAVGCWYLAGDACRRRHSCRWRCYGTVVFSAIRLVMPIRTMPAVFDAWQRWPRYSPGTDSVLTIRYSAWSIRLPTRRWPGDYSNLIDIYSRWCRLLCCSCLLVVIQWPVTCWLYTYADTCRTALFSVTLLCLFYRDDILLTLTPVAALNIVGWRFSCHSHDVQRWLVAT